MATKIKAQISMEDNIVTDKALEELLESRQTAKKSVSDYRKCDKDCREKIATITTPMPYRVGRFIISKATTAAKSVAFETAEATRITIKTVDSD